MANLNILISAKDQATSALQSVNREMDQTASKAGSANKAFAAMGIGLAAVGVAAAGVVIAVGKAAFDVQTDFDGATDALIKGTGASGEALDAMAQSVRNLKMGTAGLDTDMTTIGATMAEVNTRTGATGAALETLTGSIMDFSRLTGTDSVNNVRLLTRTMGDWGVSLDDSGELLDKVYGAGQAFGIGIDSLAGKLVQFGAPLRQMGFTLDESIAMLGKWEKEGVNTEMVLASLKIAAGTFAEQGVDLREGLEATSEAIKNAATDSDALIIAMEVFGKRAGPDMAAAIREGRFSLEDAAAALEATSGSLKDSTTRTMDFQERWQMATARIQDALIPLGAKLYELADQAMPYVEAAITSLIEVGQVLIQWTIDATTNFNKLLAPVLAYAAAVYTAGVGSASAQEAMAGLPEWAQGLASAFEELAPYWDTLVGKFTVVGDQVATFLQPAIDNLQTAFGDMLTGFQALGPELEGLGTAFGTLMTALEPVITFLSEVVVVTFDLLLNTVSEVMRAMPMLVGTAITVVSILFNLMAANITNVISLVQALFAGDWATAWELVKTIVSDNVEAVKGIFGALVENIGTIGTAILDAIEATLTDVGIYLGEVDLAAPFRSARIAAGIAFGTLLSMVQEAIGGVQSWLETYVLNNPFEPFREAIRQSVDNARNSIQTILSSLKIWISNLSLPNPFVAFGEGIVNAVTGAIDSIKDAFTGFMTWLEGFKPKNPFEGWSFPEFDWGAGASNLPGGHGAIGRSAFRGGVITLGENGPERVILPSGSRVVPNQLAAAGAGQPQTIQVVIPGLTVRSELDIQSIAYKVADILSR